MNKEAEKNKESRRANNKTDSDAIPSQHLPYPHAPSKKDHARKYARFMEIFKQLQINIPFSEAINQMPKYAKFMKDILTKKKRPKEEEVVVLDAQCSAIVSRLPQKARDPGRVTLPVTVGNQHIGNRLIDLGSSINLIPLSIVKRLGNIEMKSTRMTLQLADKSTTLPYGVAQDIVQDEEVCFNLFEAMKQPKDKRDCFRLDVTEETTIEVASEIHLSNPLERSLVDSFNVLTQEEEREIEGFVKEMEKGGSMNDKDEKVEILDPPKEVAKVLEKCGIKHKIASPYHPQTNGQAEISNRAIKNILEKIVSVYRKYWSAQIDDSLWAYRTTYKAPIGASPFQMVYGKACHLPVEIEHKALWALCFFNRDDSLAFKKRKEQIHELEEFRLGIFSDKLKSKWSGPFMVKEVKPYGAIVIEDSKTKESWTVNGERLKVYLGGEFDQEVCILELLNM
ncbi:uncharacterized protein LOC131637777 [Vicia villosa]|uniref:uncharacterized protein LOC131637777 n=1 Tax=Vicia villosa TaxID=3911 RepID=UPI00273BFD90|nr:uncharacterized protein LOC131637777 [Vicia villosa]